MKSARGFTLIELLVVISIIGILVSILTVNFNNARDDARNKALRTSLSQVQLALEVFKAQNKSYPTTLTQLLPEYIAKIPSTADSGNTACSIIYNTYSSSTSYKLVAQRCVTGVTAQANGIQPADDFARCPSSCPSTGNCVSSQQNFFESLAVYSPGAACQ